MNAVFVLMVGALVTTAVYMFLARDLPRLLIGFVLLGTAANLAILAAGRVGSMTPPLVIAGASSLVEGAANPLPQALILTAIVIGFGLTAFALMLTVKAYAMFGTVSAEEMQEAEEGPASSLAEPQPPVRQREAA